MILTGALALAAALIGAPADAGAPGASRSPRDADEVDLFGGEAAPSDRSEETAKDDARAPEEGEAEAAEDRASSSPEGATVDDGSDLEWDGGDFDLSEYEDEDDGGSSSAPAGAGSDAEEEELTPQQRKQRRRSARTAKAREILTGSARLLGVYVHNSEPMRDAGFEDDAIAAGVFRLLIDHAFNKYVSVESNLFLDVSRAPAYALGGNFATAGSTASTYRLGYLSGNFWRSGSVTGQLGLDRLALGIEAGPVSISLGRYPINHTVSNFFTPNDFFAPFSAGAINRIYKPGVDALSVSIMLGAFSSLEFVGALGYAGDDRYTLTLDPADPAAAPTLTLTPDNGCAPAPADGQPSRWNGNCIPSWGRSAVYARISAVKWSVEWAALGGKVAERWVAGGSIQGDAGPVNLRAEGHVGFPDHDGDGRLMEDTVINPDGTVELNDRDRAIYGRVAGGFDVAFVWQNANLAAEYAYIHDGGAAPEDYFARAFNVYPDSVAYFGRHQVGVSAGLDIIPILKLQAFSLVNATDGSGLAGPLLMLSVSDEVDLMAGMYVPWGRKPEFVTDDDGEPLIEDGAETAEITALRSANGAAPLSLFLEMRAYF